MKRIVVAALGNDLRRDDGVGRAVVRSLGGRLPLALGRSEEPGVRVMLDVAEPADLIDGWRGTDLAVVVDAVRSGAAAGSARRYEVGQDGLPDEPFGVSSHLLPLPRVVELARVLDALPGRLVVFGVEGEDFAPGEGLTPAVAGCVERVAADVLEEIAAAMAP